MIEKADARACWATPWMQMAAGLVIAVVVIGPPAARARQDAGSSSESSSQQPPASQESSKAPATDQEPPSKNQTESKADASRPEGVDKPAAGKAATGPAAPAHKRRSRGSKPADVPAAEGETRKVEIRRGGVSEPVTQIIPGMSLEDSNRQRQEAEDLLTAAASDLKNLASRSLNSNQQEVVSQIRHYMDVARSALSDGDIQRAHRLAQKAQLLSDDLMKHQ